MHSRTYFDTRLNELDWDYFGDVSESPFSNLHFHPGRYISQIPAAVIGCLTEPGEVVLDPFCGSGTTLVEAQRLGRKSIGIDINPVSVLISRAKLIRSNGARASYLLNFHLENLLNSQLSDRTYSAKMQNYPTDVQFNKWYHNETANQLKQIWDYISLQKGYSKLLLDFCFSSILLQVCSENRHWGYVCDNTRPLSKIYIDALTAFKESVRGLSNAYLVREKLLGRTKSTFLQQSKVIQRDACAEVNAYPDSCIDLVVTSPPYFGVVDYVKSQRLSMEWFGQEIDSFRILETGARSKRGRIRGQAEYMDQLSALCKAVYLVLKPERYFVLVLGESSKRPSIMDSIVENISKIGFVLEKTELRVIAKSRAQAPGLLKENVFFFRKSSAPRY